MHLEIRKTVGIALFLLMAACENPFSTRTPEPPEQNSSTFIPPTSPDVVFINLRVAIREKNVENYIRCFVDSTRSNQRFTFVADPLAAFNHSELLSWDLRDERGYVVRLFQATPSDSTRILTITNGSPTPDGPDQATLSTNYTIIIEHTQQGTPTVYRGLSNFLLEKNQTGDWAIYRWSDFNTGVDPSWSELKALF